MRHVLYFVGVIAAIFACVGVGLGARGLCLAAGIGGGTSGGANGVGLASGLVAAVAGLCVILAANDANLDRRRRAAAGDNEDRPSGAPPDRRQ